MLRVDTENPCENENFTAQRPSPLRKLSQSSNEFESECDLNTRHRSESTKRKKIANNIPARLVARAAEKKLCLCSQQDDKTGSNAAGDTGECRIYFFH